jgi:methylenetetrahydrofolate reductase (NADPH)
MTKISALLAAGRTFSVEFMGPRSEEALRDLEKTMGELSPLDISFCSVTYGAGGSSREGTHEGVLHIHRSGHVAMPHLTCVGHTRDEVVGILEQYRDEGLSNVLALAGDPPRDGSPVKGDFRFAVELIELARSIGDYAVGVSAFPEVHPKSPDRATDRKRLAEKLAQADFGITQFFWKAEHYFRMRDELDALRCTTPVIPSVFPIINTATARRFSAMNGSVIPDELEARLDAVEGDAEATRALGVEVATAMSAELLAGDIPGLHVYTMNRSESVLEIWRNLGL